jgi:hypothetical protein
MTKFIIQCFICGYVLGAFVHDSAPQFSYFTFYTIIPFGITLDNIYVAIQALNEASQASNNTVAVAQTLPLAQTEAQTLYAELLPTLGFDFLAQYSEFELKLLLFHLQSMGVTVDSTLEYCLTNASLHSLNTHSTIVPLLFLPNNSITQAHFLDR